MHAEQYRILRVPVIIVEFFEILFISTQSQDVSQIKMTEIKSFLAKASVDYFS